MYKSEVEVKNPVIEEVIVHQSLDVSKPDAEVTELANHLVRIFT